MAVTMADVARRAGVSRTTVSFVLNKRADVSLPETTRARVWAAAEGLGWRPHPVARALRAGRTKLIGLWPPVAATPHYARVARLFLDLLRRDGYSAVIVEQVAADPDPLGRVLELPLDGVVTVNLNRHLDSVQEGRAASRLPVVAIDHDVLPHVDSVAYDIVYGAQQAMAHLLALGRPRVAYIGVSHSLQDERYLTYLQATEEAGLAPEVVFVSDQRRATARQAVRRHVQANGAPGALFCGNDEMAIGAYRGLLDAGVRIPADTAIVGCDDVEDVLYLDCPLSTISTPVARMLATAWDFLQQRLADPERPVQHARFRSELVIRESSTPNARNC